MSNRMFNVTTFMAYSQHRIQFDSDFIHLVLSHCKSATEKFARILLRTLSNATIFVLISYETFTLVLMDQRRKFEKAKNICYQFSVCSFYT